MKTDNKFLSATKYLQHKTKHQLPQNLRRSLLFLILLLSTLFAAEAQLNINHFMRVGRTRIAIGNYTGAIEYFNIVIEFKPHLAEAYLYRGIAKHSLEDYRGAIADYNKAIEIKPFYPQAYNNRGMAYHNLRLYSKAIEDYNRALEFDPNDETIYINRGLAKLARRDIDGALADYNKALEINPKSTQALMYRSNARIVSGDIKGAIEDLNQVIILRPHFAAAYLNRGLARFELGDYASALRDYDQSIKLEPDNALAYNNRGIVKHKLEDYQAAIIDYDMAIQLNPEMASAWFNRAMAKEVLGIPGYEEDYRVAAKLNPRFDLNQMRLDAQQMAQKQQNQQSSGGTNNSQQTQDEPNDQVAQHAPKPKILTPEEEEELRRKELEERNKRRKMAAELIVEDTRDLPQPEDTPNEKQRLQDQDIAIDLQPLFYISAFEKNNPDYERFQYYNLTVDQLNSENNYYPTLNITNRKVNNKVVFENLILLFNERIQVKETANNYLCRGIFFSLTEQYNKAMQDLNKAIDMDEKLSLGYFSRANTRYKMQELVEQAAGSAPTLSFDSSPADSLQNQFIFESEYLKILNDYNTTLNLDPSFFFGYFNRAYIKLRLGKYEDAIEDLNRAIELEPKFAEAYFNRGLTKIYLNDIDGGAMDLSKAGELGIVGAYNIIKRYCN